MADEMQKELAEVLKIRRIRLQRAEARVAQAQGEEKRAARKVVEKEEAAAQTASDNAERESALALELFNRKTNLSHIEKFRREVGDLRKHTAAAKEEVVDAKKARNEAKSQVKQALEGQRGAYRAVEKLEVVLQDIKEEADIVRERRSPDE
jgi:hypothetical protein